MTSSISNRTAIALVLAGIALGGCKNIAFQRAVDDTRAKRFSVATAKAAVYVVRPDSIRNMPLPVALDDKFVARTGPCSYVLWEVDPGAHQILAYGENISQLTLRTEAGKAYFVRQDVTGGLWSPRTILVPMEDAAGRMAVSDCRLIDSGVPGK